MQTSTAFIALEALKLVKQLRPFFGRPLFVTFGPYNWQKIQEAWLGPHPPSPLLIALPHWLLASKPEYLAALLYPFIISALLLDDAEPQDVLYDPVSGMSVRYVSTMTEHERQQVKVIPLI